MKATSIGQAVWFVGMKRGVTINHKLIPMTMILPPTEEFKKKVPEKELSDNSQKKKNSSSQ